MISDILVRQGNWLFRWRSYVLAAFIPLVLYSLYGPEPVEAAFGKGVDSAYEMVCAAVAGLGLLLRCLTVGFVPAGTSGRNTRSQVAESLNTTGMYSLTRNPLYFANAVTVMGIAMFTQSLVVMLSLTLFLVVYLERIIAAEERFLTEKYGEVYLAWARRVPAFFPRFSGWHAPEMGFSVKTVLKREYTTLLILVGSLCAIDQIRDMGSQANPHWDLHWFVLLGLSLFSYVSLRWMKKHTGLLDVEGR